MSIPDIMASNDANPGIPADNNEPKGARLELRSTEKQKSLIERAASLMGESVTSFVLSTAIRDAVRIINDHEITELSVRDWTLFNELMESGDEPDRRLIDAVKEYQHRVARSDGF